VANCYVAKCYVASCVVANCVVASCYVANCMGIENIDTEITICIDHVLVYIMAGFLFYHV
jgi:hypothetical protein